MLTWKRQGKRFGTVGSDMGAKNERGQGGIRKVAVVLWGVVCGVRVRVSGDGWK